MNLGQLTARRLLLWSLSFTFIMVSCSASFCQTQPPATNSQSKTAPTTEKNLLAHILDDQKGIWTAPFHLQREDAKWIVPLGLSMATLMATDTRTSAELIENGDNQDRLRISKDVSYAGSLYSVGGISALFYVAGKLRHDERAKETGLLAAEALINGTIISNAIKAASGRQRPRFDHGTGEFWDGGSSFPSGHAINSWSLATVISEEYGPRHPAVRYAAYGLATAVSASRYTGRKHFLSDVLAGAALGYGIGRYVYHQHHDSALEGNNENQTSRLLRSKYVPAIVPSFDGHIHSYGASLTWSF